MRGYHKYSFQLLPPNKYAFVFSGHYNMADATSDHPSFSSLSLLKRARLYSRPPLQLRRSQTAPGPLGLCLLQRVARRWIHGDLRL